MMLELISKWRLLVIAIDGHGQRQTPHGEVPGIRQEAVLCTAVKAGHSGHNPRSNCCWPLLSKAYVGDGPMSRAAVVGHAMAQ